MHIVLGATGHVGSAVAAELLASGEAVTVVTRDPDKAAGWRARGAEAAVVDVSEVGRLHDVFARGRRAFLLNPPAPPSGDTNAEEHRTLHAIVAALEGSGLEKVVLQSTYGAQPGNRIGDLSVLYDFEQALSRQPIPVAVLRAAYYMSNWDPLLDAARAGTLPTMFPADMVLPMVAPADIGSAAARLMREGPEATGMTCIEGPERYSSEDVAAAFGRALGRDVAVVVTPPERWEEAYRELGFSEAAAQAFARMMAVNVEGVAMPDAPTRGTTTLQAYVDDLVASAAA